MANVSLRTSAMCVLCAIVFTMTVVMAVTEKDEGDKPAHKMLFSARTKPGCVYEQRRYRAGQRFRPDECTKCKCPRNGGRLRCSVQDCRWEPNCISYDKSENKCCGKCTEYGCLGGNGTVYRLGETINRTRCEKCVCPKQGGPPRCLPLKRCPNLACVDPVLEKGSCCKRCPNGRNCWLKDRVIKAGRVVKGDDGRLYKCPEGKTSIWQRRDALCLDCDDQY